MLQALKNLEARSPRAATPPAPAEQAVCEEQTLPQEQPVAVAPFSRAEWTVERLAAALQLPDVAGKAVGFRSQEPGVRSQEPGVRSQETEERGRETGARSQEPGVRDQEAGDRGQGAGDRSQESGVRGRERGVGGRESGVGGRGTEGGAKANSPLERLVRGMLSDPSRARMVEQMAERLGRDLAQSGSKSVALVGIGKESSTHGALLCAAALLGERQQDVLIVDANLSRRPLSEGLQTGQEAGLAELLRGSSGAREHCRPTAFSRVSFLPAGQLRHIDLSSAGSRLDEIVREFGREYSLALFDGGQSSDLAATTLARLCDATYFVVQLGTVEANEAQAALRDFRAAGARVLGCIAT